jgi:signal transduction histidine kinase
VNIACIPARSADAPLTQLVLEDITEERAEGYRVHRFAGLLLKVQEEERRRIAQELHDEPLQLLIHLARSLERLETTPQNPATLAGGFAGARRQSLDIAARLRAVVAGLRPPTLEQLGLTAALRGFLADTGEVASFRADMRVTGTETRLPPEIELAAFRIAQEAVNNVIRHADASRLALTLAFGDGGLCLSVADDGRGFDPRHSTGSCRAGGWACSACASGQHSRAVG